MIVYSCKVGSCPSAHLQTTERSAIFRHYITHLKDEIEETALGFGLSIFDENKYSLINSIIPHSKSQVLTS